MSKVLYTCTPNGSYAYFLNVEPSNLVFLKTYYTEFDENICKKYKKQILDKGLDTSKILVYKAGEFIGNKIADAVTKSNEIILRNKNLLEK